MAGEAEDESKEPEEETTVADAPEATSEVSDDAGEGDSESGDDATDKGASSESNSEVEEPAAEPIPVAFRTLPPMRGHSGAATAVAYAPGGDFLLSGGADGTIMRYCAVTLVQTQVLTGHSDEVTSLAISPDQRFFVSGSQDRTARLWNTESGQTKNQFKGFKEGVSGVCFSPDGEQVVASSFDGTARVWATATGKELAVLEGDNPFTSVIFHPGGKRLMVGASNSITHAYDTSSWKVEGKPFKGSHGNWVSSVAFSANGKQFASASLDSSVCVWDQKKGKERHFHKGGKKWVQAVQVSPDGKFLFSASRDGKVTVWDAEAEAQEALLEGRGVALNDLALFSRGTRVAAACDDGSIQVWAIQGMEWADWTPGGGAAAVAEEEEEEEATGPNPAYYDDGVFNYAKWKADNAGLFK